MAVCRDIKELSPYMQEKARQLKEECKKSGIDIMFIETYRKSQIQEAYYSQGRLPLVKVNYLRVVAGLELISEKENQKIITNAKSGQSAHEDREAFDVVPVVNKKIVWDRIDLFKKISEIGKKLGLVSGADFKFKDYPHYQNPNWKIRNG